MSEPPRYLIVSLGSIGRRHLANLRSLRPEAQIAVWRQHTRSSTGDIPQHADLVFNNERDAIGFGAQAAIIASPASTHAATAKSLAAAGVHLLIEKPLTTDLNTAVGIREAVEQAGVIAMLGYSLRFLPGLCAAKQAIDDGRLGRVVSVRAEVGQYLPDWRPDQDYRQAVSANAGLGGGALLELSHELDYLNWIFGTPQRVSAHGGKFGPLDLDVEDLVEIVMLYERQKLLISVHLDFLDRAASRKLRVVGETGTLCWDAADDKVRLFDSANRQWHELDSEKLSDRNQMYIRELQHFLHCVERREPPNIDMQHGCDVLKIIDACRSSMTAGHSSKVS